MDRGGEARGHCGQGGAGAQPDRTGVRGDASERGHLARGLHHAPPRPGKEDCRTGGAAHPHQRAPVDEGRRFGDRGQAQEEGAEALPRAHPRLGAALEGRGGARDGGERAGAPGEGRGGGVLPPLRRPLARPRQAGGLRQRQKGAQRREEEGALGAPDLVHGGQAGGGKRQRAEREQDPGEEHPAVHRHEAKDCRRPRLLAPAGGGGGARWVPGCRRGPDTRVHQRECHRLGEEEDLGGGGGRAPGPRSRALRAHRLRVPPADPQHQEEDLDGGGAAGEEARHPRGARRAAQEGDDHVPQGLAPLADGRQGEVDLRGPRGRADHPRRGLQDQPGQ
mmetsp:Transcript_33064/g.84781  ORF Transcript_33064/g.84781 Transcript_33064/m.84781 type:complete len:335 (+) Transcript_33064:698-1702(+)